MDTVVVFSVPTDIVSLVKNHIVMLDSLWKAALSVSHYLVLFTQCQNFMMVAMVIIVKLVRSYVMESHVRCNANNQVSNMFEGGKKTVNGSLVYRLCVITVK